MTETELKDGEMRIGDRVFSRKDVETNSPEMVAAMAVEIAALRERLLDRAGSCVPAFMIKEPYRKLSPAAKAQIRREHRRLFPRGDSLLAGESDAAARYIMETLRQAQRSATRNFERVGSISLEPPKVERRRPWTNVVERNNIAITRDFGPVGCVGGQAAMYPTLRGEISEAEVPRFAVLSSWREALDDSVDAWYFSCRNGDYLALDAPAYEYPFCVKLPREWDPAADEDVAQLDLIRWAPDRPTVIVQPGEGEPE